MELWSEQSGYFNLNLPDVLPLFFRRLRTVFAKKKPIFRKNGEKLFPRRGQVPFEGRAHLETKTNITFFSGNVISNIFKYFLYYNFFKKCDFSEKTTKNNFCGGEANATTEAPSDHFF